MKTNSKKKKISIIITSIICVFIIVVSVYFTMPYCVYKTLDTSVTYDKQSNKINVNKNTIKVLQLTDLHVNGALDMPLTFSLVKKTVYKTNPDLIVLTGDLYSNGSSKKDVKKLIKFMEELSLPWATVFGNHDNETPYSISELSEMIGNANKSMFITGNLEGLYGNYFYDVEFLDGKLFQFIFMDSRSDGFTDKSVEFYLETVEGTKLKNNGQIINNFLFFHIPLSEIIDANNDGENLSGKLREKPSVQINDVDFFETAVKLGATKALIFGHDHVNDLKVNYMGVDLCYGLKSSTSSYNEINLVGGTVFTLNSNGSYTYQDVVVY